MKQRAAALIVLVLLPAAAAWAQGTEKPESVYDKLWKYADLYNDSSNDIVQRVAFTGRFQVDFVDVNADQGETSLWNVRRMRLGPRITFLRTFTFHTEFEVNPQEHDPFYVRLTDAYIAWSKNPKVVVTVGKQSVPFTSDGATSSRELISVDRSNLTNNIWFTQEYMPGVSVSGRAAPWIYRAGVYSSGAMNREFGEFNGGVFTLGLLGYDFSKAAGMREAVVTGNYLYQQPDINNTFTKRLEHIVSIHGRLDDGRWGLRADWSTAAGYLGQSDVWGVMAMPFFNVTDKLQLVGRYTFVTSGEPNGVSLATYENEITRGRGDEYNEGYVGVNYYFYGHRLKLQSGLQFADMQDKANDGGAYSGTSWVTGLRVGW